MISSLADALFAGVDAGVEVDSLDEL